MAVDLAQIIKPDERYPLPSVATAKDGGKALRGWQPIATAPHDRDVHLSVIEDGEVYALVFPCRRRGSQWAHARTGKLIEVDPTHWRDWQD